MVNLTRIYTRTGDAGETRLGDMSTTTKTDLRLQAYAGPSSWRGGDQETTTFSVRTWSSPTVFTFFANA